MTLFKFSLPEILHLDYSQGDSQNIPQNGNGIIWALYDIFIFGEWLILEQRMYFVLSSPKWIDSLLSMNYSQSVENVLFRTYSILPC